MASRRSDPVAHLVISFGLLGLGSSVPAAAVDGGRPSARAVALSEAPVVDGDILEDPVWGQVAPLERFWQLRPDEGESVSEKTEVRIGYTEGALYIAVVCFDRHSDRIIVSDARRDASLEETDSFALILDTFRDEQNGFVFGTNPAGIEYDGQVKNATDSGLGGGFSTGSGGGFNLNWDGVWTVRTQMGGYGWSAEFAIPWGTLRYPSSSEGQVWGANFQRNIRRRKESAYWAPVDRQRNLFWLQSAGSLEGIRPPPGRNLQIVPYVLAEAIDDAESDVGTETDSEVGLDLKYSVTPALTLDATVNTDFAQVEVDDQQINLDRFNLFFPEKRPFFLENAGLFSVGEPKEVELFFSRRIGIGDTGAEIPIVGGLRLSGKAAQRTNVGFLVMQTDEVAELEAPTSNFGVGRITRELPNRSFVGALFVRREERPSEAAPEGRENDTVAIDGQLGIGEYVTLSAFAARTATPGLDGEDHAFSVKSEYSSPAWRWSVGYVEVGENFSPEVGFLARSGFRKPSAFLLRRVRPRNLLGLYELRPHIYYRGYWDFDGFQETGYLHVDNHWEWPSGAQVHTGVNFTLEGVKEAFEISPGVFVPPGTYEHQEIQLVANTNAGAPVSFKSTIVAGGFFGGDRLSVDTTLSLRRGERLTSELSWSYNDIDLPGGDFEVNLGKLRLSYSLSTRLLLQALVQYNDRIDDVSTNLRFSWLRTANTGLFVVFNEIREFGTLALEEPDRNIIVKYSHLVDLFR